jgi:hypothetical protein
VLRIGQFPNTTVDQIPFSVTVTPAPRQAAAQAGTAAAWPVVYAEPWASAPAASASATAGEVAAYPNPFGAATRLAFTLDRGTDVTLVVYDVRGREVARLVEGWLEAGAHEARFDASALPSGLYLYRLQAGAEVQTGRLTVLR